MHHLKMFARSLPHGARVSGSVPCVGCGYNLCTQQAAGACPECGKQIVESLWRLAEPDRVASAMRSIGNSYVGLAGLVLVPLLGVVPASCLGWVGAGILFLASFVRALGVHELRFRAAAEFLPAIATRVRLLWVLAPIDVALAAVWPSALALGGTTDAGAGLLVVTGWLALCLSLVTTLLIAAVAGLIGADLAAILGIVSFARRLRAQWTFVTTGLAVTGVIAIAGVMHSSMFGGWVAGAVAAAGAGSFLLFALGVVGLMLFGTARLANAAERARDPLERMVASDEVHPVAFMRGAAARTPTPQGRSPDRAPPPC